MKRFLIMGLAIIALSTAIIFAGCDKGSNASSVNKANEALIGRTTEVVENIDVFNQCEIQKIETINEKCTQLRALNNELKMQKKKLKHNRDVYLDIELQITELRRSLNNLYQIRTNDHINTNKKKPSNIDTKAMELRYERMEKRAQRRCEMMDTIIADLDTLNGKICVALGKCDNAHAHNPNYQPVYETPVQLPYYFDQPVSTMPTNEPWERPIARRVIFLG